MRLRACFVSIALLGACSADSAVTLEPLEIADGCNPIAADADCLLPWPSDVFLQNDAAMPSGRRVEHPQAGLPVTDLGAPIDFLTFHSADGFPRLPQILALFPGGFDDEPLVGWTDDVSRSVTPESPTLLVDLDSGEAVLHMAEVDPRASIEGDRALVIRPLVGLRPEHRYAVAIHGLERGGVVLAAPEGFRRLREGTTSQDPRLDALAPDYEEDIFPAIEALGVERSSLQLAWDFTTRSDEHAMADMLTVRTAGLAAIGAAPTVAITTSEDAPAPDVFRRIEGAVEVPLFLDRETPGGRFLRDGSGAIAQGGTAQVPFLAMIPQSVADAGAPARVVQFGHGFFGLRTEIESEIMVQVAQRMGVILIAVDWWGLSEPDQIFVVADLFEHPNEVLALSDRVHQAVVNQLALSKAVRTGLASQAAFMDGAQELLDPDALYYYGISLGHILGSTMVAMNPEIERAALSVGGAGFSSILIRSVPVKQFVDLVATLAPNALDQQKYISLTQLGFERFDPVTYAPRLLGDTLPGSPSQRQVLIQGGLGDTSVPNLSTHAHVRTLGLPLLSPAVREIAGLELATGPVPSAFVEFDFGIPTPYPDAVADNPKEANSVHGAVRAQPEGIDQIDAFFAVGGMVAATCDGACDPG